MIYLNSQRDEGGATHFVDATLSGDCQVNLTI